MPVIIDLWHKEGLTSQLITETLEKGLTLTGNLYDHETFLRGSRRGTRDVVTDSQIGEEIIFGALEKMDEQDCGE
jgi:hypothetical protein